MKMDSQAKDAEVEVKGFDAITKRHKAQTDAVKAKRDSIAKESSNNADSGTGSKQ